MSSIEQIREEITHELKCWPEPFQATKRGDKPFEFRKDDRDYQVGDILHLREWDPMMSWAGVSNPEGPRTYPPHYTGDECHRRVTYIIREGFGIPEGYCIMGLSRLEAAPSLTVEKVMEIHKKMLEEYPLFEMPENIIWDLRSRLQAEAGDRTFTLDEVRAMLNEMLKTKGLPDRWDDWVIDEGNFRSIAKKHGIDL